ncbi:MAG: nucleotidyltransferase family protein [Anaerolineae bacterium]|nr:nucleotidyltransferase family protein [Anaerolineae bacterium]
MERLVQQHRLAPLLYRLVHGQAVVPPDTEARWQALYLATAAANSLLFRQLELILERLAQRRIPVILLKGAALATTVYAHLALRPMGDVDLLVQRRDVRSALELLTSLEYTVVRSQPNESMMLTYENAITLRHTGPQGNEVELHWSLFDSPYYQHRISTDWLWQTAVPAQIGEARALILSPEAQILHLCGHLVLHHRGHGLLWHHDIAQVMDRFADDLDWAALLERMHQYDLVLPLQQVLPSLASGWGVPVPADCLARLEAQVPSVSERRVHASLTQGRTSVARRLWADLKSMPDWSLRLRYAWASLFPPPAYMQERYRIDHLYLLPLYYPYRWLVGLCKRRE